MEPATPARPPSIWLGCDTVTWARLLARNGFAMHRSRWRVAALVTAASLLNTALGLIQRVVYGPRVARTPIRHAPLFILGHWRTGTTLLHELLGCDPRHAVPTTYDCFAPHHALLTRSWLPRLLRRLMPTRRPMDAMLAGWDRPQEDEFALCLLGQPSPYERIAFPNRLGAGAASLDSRGPLALQRHRWKRAFVRLLQEWTFRGGGRRLVLKSPPHTGRVPLLLQLFPDARFVHIVRDPYDVYPSTLHLWRVLFGVHGLQRPSWEGLPEHVLRSLTDMHERLEEAKPLLRPDRFHELRYEDLVHDPLGELEALYRELDLGDFGPAGPHVQAYLTGTRGHETNRYLLTPQERSTLTHRWGTIIRRYGYALRDD